MRIHAILAMTVVCWMGCSDPADQFVVDPALRPQAAGTGEFVATVALRAEVIRVEAANGHGFAAEPGVPLLRTDSLILPARGFVVLQLKNNLVVRLDQAGRTRLAEVAALDAPVSKVSVKEQLAKVLTPEESQEVDRIVGWHARRSAAQSVPTERELVPEDSMAVAPMQAQPEPPVEASTADGELEESRTKPRASLKAKTERARTHLEERAPDKEDRAPRPQAKILPPESRRVPLSAGKKMSMKAAPKPRPSPPPPPSGAATRGGAPAPSRNEDVAGVGIGIGSDSGVKGQGIESGGGGGGGDLAKSSPRTKSQLQVTVYSYSLRSGKSWSKAVVATPTGFPDLLPALTICLNRHLAQDKVKRGLLPLDLDLVEGNVTMAKLKGADSAPACLMRVLKRWKPHKTLQNVRIRILLRVR